VNEKEECTKEKDELITEMNEQCQEQRESLREALTKECSREKAEAEFILIDEHDIKCDQEKLEMVTE